MKGYLELLRLPGVLAAAVPAAVARLAVSMVALALLLACVETGYGYAVAGTVSAAYAAGYAVAGPVLGRLIDRAGAAVVVGLAGVAAAVALGTAATGVGRFAAAALVATALLAGGCTPPVGASMRAVWTRLTDDETVLRRAYALEATLSEALYVVGPACLTGLAVVFNARVALGVTAVLLFTGCAGYSRAPLSRRATGAPPVARAGRPSAALVTVLAGTACTAAMTGALTVSIAVALPEQGSLVALTGAVLALQSVASIGGGLAYGALRVRAGVFSRYLWLLGGLAVTFCLLPVSVLAYRGGLPAGTALVLLCLLLLPSGALIAPTGAAEFHLVGDMTPPARMTQTFAVVGAVIALGDAGGVALAGLVAGSSGTMTTLLLPAMCAALGLAVALVGWRTVTAALSARAAPLEGRELAR